MLDVPAQLVRLADGLRGKARGGRMKQCIGTGGLECDDL